MSQPLPRLRMNLDFMPSPVEDRPGLLIRDSYQYSDATLIIPPVLVQCLQCFDGRQTALDMRELLVRLTGELDVSKIQEHLAETLSAAGFLEDEAFERMKAERQRAFAESPVREPVHAGAAYPDDPEELQRTLAGYMTGGAPPAGDGLMGIAAPHVSPFGGWETYRAAYSALGPQHKDRTFVILGTSHYGEPDRFGLTRKRFVTPYGEALTDLELLEKLAGEPAVNMEDYCHSIEHSIEFQVLFLQHLYGPEVRILPILCGAYANSIYKGGTPESNDHVNRFFGRLGEIAAKESDRLLWVLGIDMAHMGQRYGDEMNAYADRAEMLVVAERDRQRMDRVNAGDARGFWDLVQQNHDDLKWCGSSPLYTFLKANPGARGATRGYQQWNIDEGSVVSFGAISFQ
ncbi:MAG: AmmeMemoRadiSam system protein B [Bryobacteraceae bacterium]